MRAESAFVIATRNRPEELLEAVRSLVAQTVPPAELCIVDSSAETPARSEIEEICGQAGLPLDYHHPAPRGLTVQRNVGIDRTKGDPVFFIDDDVVLAPDCHEHILAEYRRWGPEVGGIRGERTNPARPPVISILWRKLFGLGGWWPEASGKMRAGFFVEGVSQSAGVRKLEYMNGWFMSYRREVLELERFDEALSGYGYKEDVDFSYRVFCHGYVLLQTPRARVDHLKSDADRMAPKKLQRMNLANQFYLHRKNMPQTPRYRLALWWAMLGFLVLNSGKAIRHADPGFVTGVVAGIYEQLRGSGVTPEGRPHPPNR